MYAKFPIGRSLECAAIAGLLCSVLAVGGCTRTADGTVVVAAPQVQSWTPRLPGFGRAPEPTPAPAVIGPPAPTRVAETPRRFEPPVRTPSVRRDRTQISGPRIGIRPPFENKPGGKQLTCAEQVGEGGRVKVVCN